MTVTLLSHEGHNRADLVFPDEDGMGDGQEAHQRAVLQVLQDLVLRLDIAARTGG